MDISGVSVEELNSSTVGNSWPQVTEDRAAASFRRGSGSLPDLTERLIKDGLHEEYLRYRDAYLKWRQGSPSGAVGELTEDGIRRRPSGEHREFTLRSPQEFDFFYTVSYWVGITAEIGAMLLIFPFYTGWVDLLVASKVKLVHGIALVGDLFFTTSSYLAYFEVLNVQQSSTTFLIPSWGKLRQSVSLESFVGTLGAFLAMVVWDLPAVLRLCDLDLSKPLEVVLITLPGLLGALGFLLAGICEVLHNREKSWTDTELVGSALNAFGGFLFVLGASAAFCSGAAVLSSAMYSLGITCYVGSGIAVLIMWRGNEFGLLLLRQLNASLTTSAHISIDRAPDGLRIRQRHVMGVSGPGLQAQAAGEEGPPVRSRSKTRKESGRISLRGVAFLVIKCWLIVCCIMNCVATVTVVHVDSRPFERPLEFCEAFMWVLVVTIVLIIHSAVTSVPGQQPYRFAMFAMRATLLLAAVFQSLVFARWLLRLQHPKTWPAAE